MGAVVSGIYGVIIAFLALDAMIFGIISTGFLPLVIIVMGVLVLFTPLQSTRDLYTRQTTGTPGFWFQRLRRLVFGIFMILQCLIPYGQSLGLDFLYTYGARASIETFTGQIILLAIGAIYLLASFARTRRQQITGV